MTAHNPYQGRAARRNLLAFLGGRAVSAALTFLTLMLAARVMPLTEYGTYVAALATMELALALSSGGLDWVATRNIPEFRLHAGGERLVGFIGRLISIQSSLVFVACTTLLLVGDGLARFLGLHTRGELWTMVACLVALEGTGRLARDQTLSLLMCQRLTQVAQIVRATTLAIPFAGSYLGHRAVTVEQAILFEITAAGAALMVGGVGCVAEMRRLQRSLSPSANWSPPRWKSMASMALNTYVSALLALCYGPQVVTMVVARTIGVEGAALYGFSRNFADQVRRYLPTDLLQSFVRPILVAYVGATGDSGGLMVRLGLWLKSSVFVLMPLLVFFAAFGDTGARLLGGDAYVRAWPLILLLLLGAGMMACRRVVELACNVTQSSDIGVRAAVPLLAVPWLAALILDVTREISSAVVVVLGGEVIFCAGALYALSRRGVDASGLGLLGTLRLVAAASACVLPLLWIERAFALPLIAKLASVIAGWLIVTRLSHALTEREEAIVSRILPHAILPWLGVRTHRDDPGRDA